MTQICFGGKKNKAMKPKSVYMKREFIPIIPTKAEKIQAVH